MGFKRWLIRGIICSLLVAVAVYLLELMQLFEIKIIIISILVIGFLLKAKGVTFVEFFPKKDKDAPSQVIYNNVISQSPNQGSYGVDARKVAAIMAAIQHHNKKG